MTIEHKKILRNLLRAQLLAIHDVAITQGAERAALLFGVSQDIAREVSELCGNDIAEVAEQAAEKAPWCLRLGLAPAEERTLKTLFRNASLPETKRKRLRKAEAERLAGLTLSIGRARTRNASRGGCS
ncbi:hypothetical protein BI364_07315 [Acidihalobacter yilgarnensis]|uniref:Uncharacterized protein n=1 Tax=Acidihalobacter yilgarnensis TaxID=2819280 RepID=A0A1D8IMV2_9GAMM|nr:hypothetical protein [Acidihalobacter yilgarnensis]AOU97799.1 hypothetical protein BI364_07315 [Acidihalobacter yilgarnensis]